jgi:hypothetical protein
VLEVIDHLAGPRDREAARAEQRPDQPQSLQMALVVLRLGRGGQPTLGQQALAQIELHRRHRHPALSGELGDAHAKPLDEWISVVSTIQLWIVKVSNEKE